MKSISPLRYPGGKSRLYEEIKSMVVHNNSKAYAEPFSGGFGVGLLLLQNKVVDKVFINDLDKNIFSFWKCIKQESEYLISEIIRVAQFQNIEQWKQEHDIQRRILISNCHFKKKAFATLFLNRTNRSGILKGGPIGGLSQEGKYKINCRFNAKKLIEKIQTIAAFKDQIDVYQLPYQEFLSVLSNDVFVFMDPPYVVKGGCLYMNNFKKSDHANLKEVLLDIKNPWVMTYDADPLISELYTRDKFVVNDFPLNHYAGKFKAGQEYLIYPIHSNETGSNFDKTV